LVGDGLKQLSYSGSTDTAYGSLKIQSVDPNTQEPVGSLQLLDPHITDGKLRGLLDMRDNILPQIADELGSLAQTAANAFTDQTNANASARPLTAMPGRDTGLLAGDELNFSGKTTIGIADSSGNLQHKIAVDFDAGTMSVDGGSATPFGGTIGGFVSALNT